MFKPYFSFGQIVAKSRLTRCIPLSSSQGSLQEQDDSEPDSSLSQSPNIQDWLSQARSTRTQQHHDNPLRQRVRGGRTSDFLYLTGLC